jgi:hypothetical protein
MGIQAVERAILWELNEVTGNYKLKLKDLQEWSSSEEHVKKNLRPDKGEQAFYCPRMKVWCAVIISESKKKKDMEGVGK